MNVKRPRLPVERQPGRRRYHPSGGLILIIIVSRPRLAVKVKGVAGLLTLADVARMLNGVKWAADHKSFTAKCPAHDDRNPSLHVGLGDDGRILIHDHAGCRIDDILSELRLTYRDIMPEREKVAAEAPFKTTATYYYRNGTRKTRLENGVRKKFYWQHLDPDGNWKNGDGGAPGILYKAGDDAQQIYFVEGEKDADNLAKLGKCVVSTNNGADRKWRDEFDADILDKDVVCIPDNDPVGLEHMQAMAAAMHGKARSLRVVDLAKAVPGFKQKGDISDVIADLGAKEALKALAELEAQTPEWTPVSVAETTPEVTYTKQGTPELTISNFYAVMARDEQYNGLRFNILTQHAEIHSFGEGNVLTVRDWEDADDARSKLYLEQRYGLYAPMKYDAALQILLSDRKYNPLVDIIEPLQWDGVNRCERFLTTWLKAEDSPYTREVSRLIFAGGINRLYQPGCKFDVVPVFIGQKQGEGKSATIQRLALNDAYFATTKNMSGDQKSVEAIAGAWIVEIPELAAFRTTDIESLKAFCTKTADKYRMPYERYTSVFPRRCIFIGTTNNRQFLTDKTGNRRFFPVEVFSSGYDVFDHMDEMQAFILQCWAEARDRFKRGEMPPVPDRSLVDVYREKQAGAMEDDWRVGVIEDFLNRSKSKGQLVCVKEIFHEALYKDDIARQPTAKDSREIGEIMDGLDGWERCEKSRYFSRYGKQRCWQCCFEDSGEALEQIF